MLIYYADTFGVPAFITYLSTVDSFSCGTGTDIKIGVSWKDRHDTLTIGF